MSITDMDANTLRLRCDGCPFLDRPVVAGEGPLSAERVIVGEAPGEVEVREGRPFVGDAGGRLRARLSDIGVDVSTVYITNSVLCHPKGNQSPPPKEAIAACHQRLIKEVQQRMPRKVMALGGTAAKSLTGKRTIYRLRLLHSVPSPYFDGDCEVRVTYHPSPSALNRDRAYPGRFDEDILWLGED